MVSSDMARWRIVLLIMSLRWGLCCGIRPHTETRVQSSGVVTGRPILVTSETCREQRTLQVFSVPGDVAMLSSSLSSETSVQSNSITWYKLNSDEPMSNQSGQVVIVGGTLWFLNVSLEDAGHYVAAVGGCRQKAELWVDLPLTPCGRPRTARRELSRGVSGLLKCPLSDYRMKLHSYGVSTNLTWSKDCEGVSDGTGRFSYRDTRLDVKKVESADGGLYTCTLHFSLGGVRGSVSETINASVKGDFCLTQQIREPATETVRAALGSKVTRRCLVFVPCQGSDPYVTVNLFWHFQGKEILRDPGERIYATQKWTQKQEGGIMVCRWLVISELKEQDLNLNYTCKTSSTQGGILSSYFTLRRKEPELLIPMGLAIGSSLILFLLSVFVYHVFKLELVLWFRRTFSQLCSSSDSDGKLYDAYVALPQRCSSGWTLEVERFSLNTLPQVLEEACGFSLFIPERDGVSGEAVTDSVEQNLKISRCVILLYTASTFSQRYCSHNYTLLSRLRDYKDHSRDRDHLSQNHLAQGQDHLGQGQDHLSLSQDHLSLGQDHLDQGQDHLGQGQDHFGLSQDHLSRGQDHLSRGQDHRDQDQDHLSLGQDHLGQGKDHLSLSQDHLSLGQDHHDQGQDHLGQGQEHFGLSQDHLSRGQDHLSQGQDHRDQDQDHLSLGQDQLSLGQDHLDQGQDHLSLSQDHRDQGQDHLSLSQDHLSLGQDQLDQGQDHLSLSQDHLSLSQDHLSLGQDHLDQGHDHLGQGEDHLDQGQDHLSLSQDHLGQDHLGLGWDHSCKGPCGRSQLEWVTVMHRVLVERSLKVILVELEELGPSDVEQLPESLRHLRRTQGAVCWRRTRGTRRPRRTGCSCGTRATLLSSCTSPSCRFWKEVRYRMPVRGKRAPPPETTALLPLGTGTLNRT